MPKPTTPMPDPQVLPSPALEKRSRRAYTTEYKLRILAEIDACQYGERGAILRREKLYSSQIREWRQALTEHGVAGLTKTQPGPTSRKTAEQRRVEQLEKENARLQRRLQIANDCLELQKKVLSMRDQMNTGNDA